jgi:voltage-gated potassium channel
MDHLDRYIYRYLVGVTVALIAGGTVFYHAVEKFSWLNAYYFCVVTLTTVGYGDIVPKTALGKIFTTFYIMLGVGVITTFFGVTVRRRGEKVRARSHNRPQSGPGHPDQPKPH